ncbi:hypothetical protein QAD02_013500 [Eretmocerus hayati]|uniref:Uncharacterized protein n=1 Tax=Eretmocerus hayati TaxID=131215 RepID=A0ACC2P3M3_9HYME|nr:hypothetical protein QAD02_013500 [Eretmocerus hayati]
MDKDSVLTLESDESVSEAEKRALDKIRQGQFREMASQIEERYNESAQSLPQQSVVRSQNFPGPVAKRMKVLKPTKNRSDSSSKEMIVNLSNDVQELQKDCKIIKQSLQNIEEDSAKDGANSVQFIGTVAQINKEFGVKIPFKTIEEFQKFDETFMSNEKLSSAVTNTLQIGFDPHLIITKCLVTMLKMFLAKEVAVRFVARQATAGKFNMCSTNFYKRFEALIIERIAISKAEVPGDKEIEAALSTVMSNAPSWYKVNTAQSRISSDGSVMKTTTATVHPAVKNSTTALVAIEVVDVQPNQLSIAILNDHNNGNGQHHCTIQVGATEIVGIDSGGQLMRIDESQSLGLQQTLIVAGTSDFDGINAHPSSSLQLSPVSSHPSPQCAETTAEEKDCDTDGDGASYSEGLYQNGSDENDDLNNENYLKLFRTSFT